MNRKILPLAVAFIAFALGTALVPRPSIVELPPSSPVDMVELPAPVPIAESTKPIEQFEPEFRNLDDLVWEDHKVKLIDVGHYGNAYRKSEVVAKNGERWLGLFEEEGETILHEVTTNVTLDRTYEGYGDEDYVRLTTSQPRLPHLLLKNSRRLRAGRIETSYLGPTWTEIEKRGLLAKEMRLGYKGEFAVGEKQYTLRVAPGQTKEGRKVNVLVLESDGTTQVVTHNEYFSDVNTLHDTFGYLHFAGDLDRDGKLDLYIEHYGFEKGGFSSSLCLSSEADNGELVKEAAWFGTAGC